MPTLILLLSAQITAAPVTSPPRIDGSLDEAIWRGPAQILELRQRSPQEGAPASERTFVWFAFDRDNLYVAFRAEQKQPLKGYFLQPDFDRGDDALALLIDPWKDRRNGYIFEINPNGARKDLLVTDAGRQRNKSWNGIWWAEVQQTQNAWTAELRIPFSTLNFPRGEVQTWGLNVQRRIASSREEMVWQGWQRRFSFSDPGVAGSLAGLRAIRSGQRAEFRPFALAAAIVPQAADSQLETAAGVGFDLEVLISPPVKLSLTVNPDFAQVEADTVQLNLTHHSLYLPEKRPFFLDGKNFFSFGTSASNQPFYSRRIGLNDEGETRPILAGLRLLGRQGGTRFGVLSAQMSEQAWKALRTTNASVLRLTQDIFKRSTVGAISTMKVHGEQTDLMGGLDLRLRSTEFLGKHTLEFIAAAGLSKQLGEGEGEDQGETWRLGLRWPNAVWNGHMSWERIASSYWPELGFVALRGVDRFNLRAHHTHHYKNPKAVLRNRQFGLFSGYLETDEESSDWKHYSASITPFEAVTRSGMWGKISVQGKGYELAEDWEILDDFTAKAGPHHDFGVQAMFANGWHRQLGIFTYIEEAQYFGARRSSGRLWMQLKANKHLRLSISNGLYWVRHNAGDSLARDHSLRARLSLNRALHGSVLMQWNSQTEETLINLRLRAIPRPGADAYLVINQAFDKDWQDAGTSVQGKLVWRYGI